MIRRYDIWRDSAGPGRYRGGIGYVREFQVKEDCVLTLRASGHRSASWGLAGGAGPAVSRTWINPGTPGELSLAAIETRQLKAGDVLRVERSGGGGYGSPLERPVEAVRHDIENGYVSLDGARKQYGLVLDAATRAVDQAATGARRAGLPSGRADA
jgi:N-methylhydantoinase B